MIQHHEQLPWFGWALLTFMGVGVASLAILAVDWLVRRVRRRP